MEKRNIPISLPVTGEEEWQATREPLMSGWLTSGPKVREFEQLFAERHNVKHALAVTSATTALHLACVALGVGPGDEVIVPAFTWVSTANVVLLAGSANTAVYANITTAQAFATSAGTYGNTAFNTANSAFTAANSAADQAVAFSIALG